MCSSIGVNLILYLDYLHKITRRQKHGAGGAGALGVHDKRWLMRWVAGGARWVDSACYVANGERKANSTRHATESVRHAVDGRWSVGNSRRTVGSRPAAAGVMGGQREQRTWQVGSGSSGHGKRVACSSSGKYGEREAGSSGRGESRRQRQRRACLVSSGQ
jgi:hypothetical protein